MPVGRAAAPVASTREIGTAADPIAAAGSPCSARLARPGVTGALLCEIVPQVWHSPHRPAHLLLCQPHSEHWYSVPAELLAMAGTVSAGTDSTTRSAA
jgi:hypothetical protein